MVFQDFWADTTKPGVTARSAVTIKYTGNPNPADDLPAAIPAPVNGIVNYPVHIAPMWTLNRGANTCTSCHSDPDKLDLSASISGCVSGWLFFSQCGAFSGRVSKLTVRGACNKGKSWLSRGAGVDGLCGA